MSHILYENYQPAVNKNIKGVKEIPVAKYSWMTESWKCFSLWQKSDWNGYYITIFWNWTWGLGVLFFFQNAAK